MMGDMKYDVICVGSALLDIYIKSDKLRQVPMMAYESGLALCTELGSKTEVEELDLASGGAGTNSAVSFVRKGLRTALIAEIGRDLIATTIKQELVREDVDLILMSEVEGEETGMSLILVTPDGNRTALVHRGAAKMLTNEDIAWDKLETQWLYVSSLGGNLWLMQSLIGHARDHNLKIAINPGMGEILKMRDATRLPDGQGCEIRDIFGGVDLLMVNREEAKVLTEVDFEAEAIWKSEQTIEGPKRVIITDGRNGGKYRDGDKVDFYKIIPSKVVQETGAGDAFGSGVVAALIMGKDTHTAIEWGKKQASNVVQFMGAKKGLLTLDEIR